jgi:uncharacterized protein YqeY
MSLKDQLNLDLKDAMRSGDEARKTTLRLLLAAIRQAELEKRMAAARQAGPGADLTAEQLAALDQVSLADDEVLGVIQKEAKARRESIADAQSAGRADLVADNEAELRILEGYLPQALSRDEIAALARSAITEAGVTDVKQIGAVMKLITPRTRGRADGKLVNEIVRELLAG